MKTPLRFSVLSSFCFLSLWLMIAPARAQTTRFVSTTGTNTNPASATSWATSTTNLQGAIDASATNDQVWVATGTYKPGGNANTDRTISFAMKNGVAIYGGFVGPTPGNPTGETALSQRPAINPVTGNPSSSTLSGEIGDPSSTTDNSYHVIFNPASLSLSNSAVLDGFVIMGGNANGGGNNNFGGGVYNNGSGSGQVCSPSFRNCAFLAHSAAQNGGAMYNNGRSGSCSPQLTNCIFQNNSITSGTSDGGAIYNDGRNSGTSSPQLTNCAFLANSAARNAGAMFNDGRSSGTSSPQLTNCSFQVNRAVQEAGAMYNNGSDGGTVSPQLTNCSFLSNSAVSRGGAMVSNGQTNGNALTRLTNSVFWNNVGGSPAVSVFNYSATTVAAYSLFDNPANVNVSGPGNLTTATSPFVSATSMDLNACSPAINAGNSASYTTAGGPSTDLAGNPRIVGSSIDMGAVESQGASNQPIGITGQPLATASTCPGGLVTAGVSVSGSVTRYQWFRGNTLLPGQTSATLSLTNLQPGDAGSYQVVVTGACPLGAPTSLTSTAVVVSVLPSPNALLLGQGNLSCTTPTLTLTATAGQTYQFSGPLNSLNGIVSQTNGRTCVMVNGYLICNTPIPTIGTAVVSKPGLYTVLVTNENGCPATRTIIVTGQECRP